MKSIVLAAAISLFLISCKKESGGDNQPKETLLSEIISEGLPALKFSYNSDNLVSKIESYNSDPADNSLQTYINFLYNDKGQITQFTSYDMPGSVALTKGVIQYNADGKISGASSYDLSGPTPNVANNTSTFTYNGNGKVIKIVQKNKDGKLTEQRNISYFDDGHIKESQSWKENDGALWMNGKTSFSIPGGYYPSGMDQLEVLLGSDFIGRMYSDAITYKTYSQIGVITKEWHAQMSARDYNDDGTLKKQVVTHKFIKPESDNTVFLYEYKYIKQ